jgi:hypothetical protein
VAWQRWAMSEGAARPAQSSARGGELAVIDETVPLIGSGVGHAVLSAVLLSDVAEAQAQLHAVTAGWR